MADTKILVFGGSIRTGSFSAKLAALAAKELAVAGADVDLISLADYPLPIYNADMEYQEGFPDNVKKLARLIAVHHGIFIATPEYNHSLPPLLKNAIDWVSRPKVNAEFHYRGRVYAIGSTSDGLIGGARALLDLRKVIATGLGALTLPDQIQISRAQDAFDDAGQLKDERPANTLRSLCGKLIETAGRFAA